MRWGPGAPPRGPRAWRPTPGAGRPAAAGQDAQPPPGGREERGRRGGARDTERVESGARERWRRISWARISGATMAFGKSHRDPYATSVGLLIGKEARGKTPGQALDIGVPFPFDSLVGLRRTGVGPSWRKSFPSPCNFPKASAFHPAPLRRFFMADPFYYRPSSKSTSLLMPHGQWNRTGEPRMGFRCGVFGLLQGEGIVLGQGKVIRKVPSLESTLLLCPMY